MHRALLITWTLFVASCGGGQEGEPRHTVGDGVSTDDVTTPGDDPVVPVAWERSEERICHLPVDATQAPNAEPYDCLANIDHLRALAKLGELRQASALLARCGDSCRFGVCEQLAKDVERDTPSIMMMAPGPPYEVRLDGQKLTCDDEGSTAIPVDVGPHEIVVTAPSGLHKAKDMMVRRGEKNRLLQFH